jgi:hypothetical protein
MDITTQTGGVLGIVAFAISTLGTIYAAINHKRIRSNCCGKKLEASLDVENTTPVKPVPVVSSVPSTS